MEIKPDLTARDVIQIVDKTTGGSFEIRCDSKPSLCDDPDNPVFTWCGSLHLPETGAKVADFTVPDHYPDPFITWC